MRNPDNKNTERLNYRLFNNLTILVFYATILFFIIGFNFTDVMVGGWYQQFMPNINNQPISDMTFVDSLNGYAITGDLTPNDTNYILKTTNGGDNWNVIYSAYRNHLRIKFLNTNTGFVCGGFNTSTGELIKTTNGGTNWLALNTSGSVWYDDMSVLNEDTIWLVQHSSADGGVFRTTNGGVNWTQQLSLGSSNPNKIYMYNARIGFVGKDNVYLRKTTDGGLSWTLINGAGGFLDMYFIDSLAGWKANGNISKTSNGGLNWIDQTLPSGGNISTSSMMSFSNINKDTIWGAGGILITPNGFRGILYRTTNNGSNWLFQIPDTSIHISQYYYCKFVNKLNGWAYPNFSTGVHTTTGGDTTFYTGLRQISSEVPKEFALKQNYPNPFNPRTVIHYSIKKSSYVRMTAYDITGREVQKLVDQKQPAGEYETDFMGKYSASGIYFYRMEVTDDKTLQLFAETKKMILLK